MKERQPIPAIAVSLTTSLVVAPYLLIRNYYHKKVAPISKGPFGWKSGKVGGWKIVGGWKYGKMENI